MTNKPSVTLDYTPQFKKELKRFYRKYPNVRNDIQPLIDNLQRGNFQGNQVSGVGYTVYKVRVRSTDQTKGKSGGFRVIYYLRTSRFVVLCVFITSQFARTCQWMSSAKSFTNMNAIPAATIELRHLIIAHRRR